MKSIVKILNTLLIGGFLLGTVTNILGANNNNIFQSPENPFGNELMGSQTSLNLGIDTPPPTYDPYLGDYAGAPTAGVPVDGGLSILLLAGAGLGARRMRKSLKRKM